MSTLDLRKGTSCKKFNSTLFFTDKFRKMAGRLLVTISRYLGYKNLFEVSLLLLVAVFSLSTSLSV